MLFLNQYYIFFCKARNDSYSLEDAYFCATKNFIEVFKDHVEPLEPTSVGPVTLQTGGIEGSNISTRHCGDYRDRTCRRIQKG